MNDLQSQPSLMATIVNIQTMLTLILNNHIHEYRYSSEAHFKILSKMKADELHDLQNNLMPIYNCWCSNRDKGRTMIDKHIQTDSKIYSQ